MRFFTGLGGAVLFFLISLCVAQSAFCSGSGPGDIIAKAPDPAAVIEAPQQQTVVEHDGTSQPKPVEPAVIPPAAPPETKGVNAPAAPAEQAVTASASAEQKVVSTITPP